MEFNSILRFIILIFTIFSIILVYSIPETSNILFISLILIIIEILKEIYDIRKEQKARLTAKKIDNMSDNVHGLQIDNLLLNDNIDTSVDKIIEKIDVKEKLERTAKLVTKLIDKGYITERIIYSLVKPREFYFLATYNDHPSDELKEFYPNKRQLILEIIDSFGFIQLGSHLKCYIIIPETLKKEYRDIEILKSLIIKKFQKVEKRITKEIKQKNMEIIRKGKNEEKGYQINFSFIICSAKLKDMSMEFYPFNAFSEKFREYLNGAVNLKELKKETVQVRHKIKNFILRTSNDFLLDGIKEIDRKKIIAYESNMKIDLGIEKFTDYAEISIDKLEKQLFLSLHNKEKAKKYAKEIRENCKAYTILFHELDIDF